MSREIQVINPLLNNCDLILNIASTNQHYIILTAALFMRLTFMYIKPFQALNCKNKKPYSVSLNISDYVFLFTRKKPWLRCLRCLLLLIITSKRPFSKNLEIGKNSIMEIFSPDGRVSIIEGVLYFLTIFYVIRTFFGTPNYFCDVFDAR